MGELSEVSDGDEALPSGSGGNNAGFESFLAALAASPPPYRPPSLGPGDIFADRYCVDREVGRGGMGTVYLAVDRKLGRKVALKVARGRRSESELSRLQHEATIMAGLSHPGIVTVFEADADGDDVYLSLEFVPGGTLRDWLDVETRRWREVVAMFTTIAEALSAAHRAGVIHRDFKPHNVLLDLQGRPRIADFGLARSVVEPETLDLPLLSSSGTLTLSGSIIGTPAYMAPEQAQGRQATEASDQFSFFVSMYEALADRRPFPGKTLQAILDSIETGPPSSVPNAPRALAKLIRRGLAANPEDRHPDMATVAQELERILHTRRRRARNVVFALGVLVAMGFGFLSAPSDPDPCPREDLAASIDAVWTEDVRHRVDAKAGGAAVETLDRYRAGIVDTRAAACEAHAVAGTLSQTDLALRMACLNRLEGRFAGLSTDLAEHGLPEAPLAELLAAPATCEDMRTLRRLDNAFADQSARDDAVADAAYREAERLRMTAALQSRRGEDVSATANELRTLAQRHGLGDMHAYALIFLSIQALEEDRIDALLVQAQALANEQANTRLLTEVAIQRSALALRRGDHGRASAFLENALALYRVQADADAATSERARIDLIRLEIQVAEGAIDEAVEGLRALLDTLDPRGGEAFEARELLAGALRERGDFEDAIEEYGRTLEHAAARDPAQRLGLLLNRAFTLLTIGRLDAAELDLEEVTRVLGDPEALPPVYLAYVSLGRGNAARQRGDYDDASAQLNKSRQLLEAESPDHPLLATVLDELAAVSEPHDATKALALVQDALRRHERAQGPDSLDVALTRVRVARLLQRLDRPEEATAAARKASDALVAKHRPADEIATAKLALATAMNTEDPEARSTCERSTFAICREALRWADPQPAATALSP